MVVSFLFSPLKRRFLNVVISVYTVTIPTPSGMDNELSKVTVRPGIAFQLGHRQSKEGIENTFKHYDKINKKEQ